MSAEDPEPMTGGPDPVEGVARPDDEGAQPAPPWAGDATPGDPSEPPGEEATSTGAEPSPGTGLEQPDSPREPDLSREPDPPGRPAAGVDAGLRMARLHLRMGSLPLARAELEAAAGRGTLDPRSLVALAEVRWRTGDLAGAGEAATAAIDLAADGPLAWVIAAEAIAALGRPTEARRLADAAVERLDSSLDAVFAGMPRSLIWPEDDPSALASTRPPLGEVDDVAGPASTAAAEAFAGGRAALAAGDVPLAALRLSLAIRLDPGFAAGVVTAIGARASMPLLALVAGDALRALGREDEALEAYERARQPLVVEEVDAISGVAPAANGPDRDAPLP